MDRLARDDVPFPLAEPRLQAFLKLVPAIQVFSLFDAIMLTWYFWNDVSPWFLVSWTLMMAVHGGVWWIIAARMGRGINGDPRRWRWWMLHAATETALFSLFIIVVFPGLDHAKAVVLGAFYTGLLAAGTLSKMTLLPAATVFAVGLCAGAGVGFSLSQLPSVWVAEVLLVGFGIALVTLAKGMSEVFDGRVTAERELERQRLLVTDLLTDFGEASHEGLWETDPQGRLTLVSHRFAELADRPREVLLGTELMPGDWITTTETERPFHNVEIPLQTPSGRRWWSLTGKPLREGGKVVGWRGVAADVSDRRLQEREKLRLARFDSLTGLMNRATFRSLLDGLFRPGTPISLRYLALIDVVGFGEVNESRGHAFGDALLEAVARRLESLVENTILARLDGDEFALVGPVPRSAEATVDTLSRLLLDLNSPYTVGEDRVEVTFRIGVAFTPTDAQSPDQWLRCADLALRSAKSQPDHPVQNFESDLMRQYLEKNELRSALRAAVAGRQLTMAYQPIVNLSDGSVSSCEALARWFHPERGTISPVVFIPLAEESDVILDLGLWVLEESCRTALTWPTEVSVSVNVSGAQLKSASWESDVLRILEQTGFDPHRLILEITESALVRADGKLLSMLHSLKAVGIRWALDDFGTGYSSLAYLRDFPFDQLKIDQSFLRARTEQGPSRGLLASIVALATALGLTTTAEGIEDKSHRDLLAELGCLRGQGYLFSEPVPAEKLRFPLSLDF